MKRIDVKNSEQNIAYPNSKMLYDRYIVDISKYKPLTREKELELFKRLEKNKNDVEAYNKLYQHNLLFVVSVAKRYSSSVSKSSLTLEDLISEGNLGLSVAINHFDYKTGNKLISYAVWHVRQHIIRLIENNIKTVRLPSNLVKLVAKFNKELALIEQKIGDKPSNKEVFEALKKDGTLNRTYDLTKMESVINGFKFEKSLSDKTSNSDYNLTLEDVLPNNDILQDEILNNKERKQQLTNMLDSLPLRIKKYITDYYGINQLLPLSLNEIGEKYGTKAYTVKRDIKKYLRILKNRNIKNKFEFIEN